MPNKLITDKINELIALSKAENEPCTTIVLHALNGAIMLQQEEFFAKKTALLVEEVLLPLATAQQAFGKRSAN